MHEHLPRVCGEAQVMDLDIEVQVRGKDCRNIGPGGQSWHNCEGDEPRSAN